MMPKVSRTSVNGTKTKTGKAKASKKTAAKQALAQNVVAPLVAGRDAAVLDRLWETIQSRRDADPEVSHSARLLCRGTAKIAQKFGEEAVECLIEAVSGRSRDAFVAESADVLYHLMVLWVDAKVRPEDVWAELTRREAVSGVAEKASRLRTLRIAQPIATRKIP
jgi:phosphoribosyl-ATP pyrophosphohydrolase